MSNLNVYTDGGMWYIASDMDHLLNLLCRDGMQIEPNEEIRWHQCNPDEPFTFIDDPYADEEDQIKTTQAFREWTAQGEGFLATTEW